jgi:hypothetical protein
MRIANRIASAVLALALIAAGGLAIIEAILAATNQRPLLPLNRWYGTLTSTSYSDRIILALSIAIGLLGLVILISQLRRWKPKELSLDERWQIQRASVENQITNAVSRVPGVSAASTTVHGTRAKWDVRVKALARPETLTQAKEAAQDVLSRLTAPAGATVNIDVQQPRRVS